MDILLTIYEGATRITVKYNVKIGKIGLLECGLPRISSTVSRIIRFLRRYSGFVGERCKPAGLCPQRAGGAASATALTLGGGFRRLL